jgi:hypothetical protein
MHQLMQRQGIPILKEKKKNICSLGIDARLLGRLFSIEELNYVIQPKLKDKIGLGNTFLNWLIPTYFYVGSF